MSANPVRWFEIYVQDMHRAKAFYEAVFLVKLEQLTSPDLEMWAFPMHMEKAGASGALVKMEGCPSGGNSTIIYFGSDDCAVEAARIPAAGGRIFKDKMSIGPYGFIVLAFDPDGNMFGIHSMK
ncbi:VOC family protein [Humisphaera borealis]|uniref:VOC family protein n=1 Tax=Humisphaera borealis TaxID=2807512 RepID=A0A7M2WT88_9BACT|nr:VOC family protein [Humisphaera borealis]QOV88727.1 VOC family protein [Humisphaera borealis]